LNFIRFVPDQRLRSTCELLLGESIRGDHSAEQHRSHSGAQQRAQDGDHYLALCRIAVGGRGIARLGLESLRSPSSTPLTKKPAQFGAGLVSNS
jgi:hypothetical protein